MSAAQIQLEKQNFLDALNRGQITFDQYQQAMAVYKNQPTQPTTTPATIEENPYASGQSSQEFTYVNPALTPATIEENPYASGQSSQEFTYVNPALIPKPSKAEEPLMEPAPTVNYDNPTPSAGPHPQRMYTTEEGTKIVTEGQENLKRTALITGSILAAPIIGPSGVLLGAGLGVGVSQGIKAVSGGGFLSGEELFESATTGIIFSGAGKLATTGLQAIGAGAVVEGVGTGATKIVSGAAGRIGVNTALGAGGSYVLSGGNPEAAVEGAKYGLIFGVGGEVIGVVASRVPVPKYGEVKVPLELKPGAKIEVTPELLPPGRSKVVTEIAQRQIDYVTEKYGYSAPKIEINPMESGRISKVPGEPAVIKLGTKYNDATTEVISSHELGHYIYERNPVEASKVTNSNYMLPTKSSGIPVDVALNEQIAWDIARTIPKSPAATRAFEVVKQKALDTYITNKEPFGLNAQNSAVVIPKYATWRGIYLSRGSEATPIIGKSSFVPEGVSIKKGYVPTSNIESVVTLDVMGKAGYDPSTIQNVRDVRTVMRTTQNTKPTTIDEALPTETGTLNSAGVKAVKEYVLTNKGDVEMLYGSYATKPQLSKSFEYSKAGKSALRTPGDIDIQLTTGEQGAVKFASELTTKLRSTGADVRVSAEKPTLIEANVGGGKYAHAVDIHFRGEKPVDVLTPTRDVAWGFKFEKPTVQQEGIPTMALNEQGLRKGASILGFKEVPEGMVGPRLRRVKDIPDYFQVQRTLIEKMPTRKTAGAREALTRSEEYYGVDYTTDIPATPQRVAFNPRAEAVTNNAFGVKVQKTAAFTSGSTLADRTSGVDITAVGKSIQSPSVATRAVSPQSIGYSQITKLPTQQSQGIMKQPYPQTSMPSRNLITQSSQSVNKITSSPNIAGLDKAYSPSTSAETQRGRIGFTVPKFRQDDDNGHRIFGGIPKIKIEEPPSQHTWIGEEPKIYYTLRDNGGPSYPIYPHKDKSPTPQPPKPSIPNLPDYNPPSKDPDSSPPYYPIGDYPYDPQPSPYPYYSGKSKKSSGPFGSQMGLSQPNMIRSSGGLLKGKRRKEYPVLDASALLNKGN